MDIEQIRAAAEAESCYLNGRSCIRILVSSLSTDSGTAGLLKAFRDAASESGLDIKIIRAGSFGCYDLEPVVVIEASDSMGVLYYSVTPDDVSFLIGDCGKNSLHKQNKALCWIGKEEVNGLPRIDELPLFQLQNRIALRNCGWIDPEDISHYIRRGHGYTGLSRALQMEKGELLSVLTESALKGRNEAGGSTAENWKNCHESKEEDKYLICSAIDMAPQALTARLLFESDPHSVLEGMLISAFAVGASRCIIFIKENSNSVQKIAKALKQMRARNLLGDNILDSSFSSDIEIREVSASGALGYQTELFHCIEEKQPPPHIHPVYPVSDELERRPVIITSPEIMSNLSAALSGDMEKASASKVITVSGSMIHKCTVEVALNTSIRTIVDELGGGGAGKKAIKAAKLGSPAGVFIAADSFEQSLDSFNSRNPNPEFSLGTIEVFDCDVRIVDAAKEVMSYIQAQSCGRCVFCREGTIQMLTILEDITEDKGKPRDLELLAELGEEMKTACLCSFGRSAPDPVLSSIQHFRSEYDERIKG